MRVHVILREASLIWLVVGTIMVIVSGSRGFELSITYLLAVFISWGLIVGLPFSILREVGRWLERKSQNTPSANEKEEL